jgi:DNA-binding NarL/FixJ family response regulator
MNIIRIGFFDDHAMIGKGLNTLIDNFKSDFSSVFVANDKATLIKNLSTQEIDVLILDIVAPDVVGLELFEMVVSDFPEIKVLAYSSLNSPILIENLLSIGVMGFVNKKEDENVILNAIISVYNDTIFVEDQYKYLTSKYRELVPTILSEREIEILKLISQELTSQEIAAQLHISIRTVENHRTNIFKKLDVKNTAGLIMAANRLGYLS